ncbi:ribose ABC transporter permease [Bartonella sp. HY329]|uniref:ribose ABC transporter permease n=1 Tax=unclassified Bartonella TaxID=2645622 RepID=UPI0021C95584|nr:MULTISPECIES: ribose ABC transporter permease [unclassified Bartonella]UXM94826.1 ribose ABC transporter permease [Bartonella sp. HY329]UXN09149.1 ribose ABC transporter permease [Bartonella sp. HY328]
MTRQAASPVSEGFLKILTNPALWGLIILVVAVAIRQPEFLEQRNILNLLRQASPNALIALGMTCVILTGGIDLSVGSVLAISGAIAASLIGLGYDAFLAMGAALMVGVVLGSVSGAIITYGRVQPFVATLVTMSILRGATLVYTNGQPINLGFGDNADIFSFIGTGYIGVVPFPVILTLAFFIIGGIILTCTRFGRYVYAIGGNETVARLAGVNVNRVKIAVYALCGFTAALAAIIETSRLGSAQPTAGTSYELDAIAAVVVGGTSLSGGRGTLFGTLIGALIIGVLNNALNTLEVSSYYQQIAKGGVILLAVLADRRSKA